MNQLTIEIEREAFHPGEKIRGSVAWSFEAEPEGVELRLFWHTEGKGDRDLRVVDRVRFEFPSRVGTKPFEFTLPTEPYSFSGRLISVIWALELSELKSDEAALREIVVSPTLEAKRL